MGRKPKDDKQLSITATEEQEETMTEEVTETPDTTVEEKPTMALAKADQTYLSPACQDLAGNPNPLFLTRYDARLRSCTKPSTAELKRIIQALPADLSERVIKLLRQINPDRPGMILSADRPEFTELRLNQGVGDDPNRPETCMVGSFYVTTRKNVGKEFIGTPIAIWEGRTNWPPRGGDDVIKAPVCTSMDRIVGSKFGLCETCHQRPWKDGKPTNCSNDVVAFMLPKDLSDLVIVRYNRASVKAGQQLISLAKKDFIQWQRWFRVTAEKKTVGDKRWFEFRTSPLEGEGIETEVPDALLDFCAVLSQLAMHDYILPGLARIYRLAQEAGNAGVEAPAEKTVYDTFEM